MYIGILLHFSGGIKLFQCVVPDSHTKHNNTREDKHKQNNTREAIPSGCFLMLSFSY